jgi:hypothetical protein
MAALPAAGKGPVAPGREQEDTAVSLLIIALVAIVIWSGSQKNNPVPAVPAASEQKVADVPEPTTEIIPASEERQSVAPPARENSPYQPALWPLVPQLAFIPPRVAEPIAFLPGLYALPNLGRISQPLISSRWLESFEMFCRGTMLRSADDCMQLRALLDELRQIPDEPVSSWAGEKMEALSGTLAQLFAIQSLQAYQVSCSSRGCLMFVAVQAGTNWDVMDQQLVDGYLSSAWSQDLNFRREGMLGGAFQDGSGLWNVFLFERLGVESEPEQAHP